MLNNFNNLLPFRIEHPHDIITWYSLGNTGLGGQFVSMYTGNNAPDGDPTVLSTSTPGYPYSNVTNFRFETPRKVYPSTSGQTKFDVLGLTLDGTIEYDENGLKILFYPQRQVELQCVPSGYSVRIAADGVFTLKSAAYSGTPLPGYVGTISNTTPGTITWQAYSAITAVTGDPSTIVCKALSSSGSNFSGYAQIKLMLK